MGRFVLDNWRSIIMTLRSESRLCDQPVERPEMQFIYRFDAEKSYWRSRAKDEVILTAQKYEGGIRVRGLPVHAENTWTPLNSQPDPLSSCISRCRVSADAYLTGSLANLRIVVNTQRQVLPT